MTPYPLLLASFAFADACLLILLEIFREKSAPLTNAAVTACAEVKAPIKLAQDVQQQAKDPV